jgi:3-hydroxyisobutyrate dehydrogenase-like beta-hydroxyacid dehydrogenase
MKSLPTVAFIGLGAMGSAMAHRLATAGHPLRVHARRPEAMAELVAFGATGTPSPAACARGAEFIFTSVTGSADVQQVLFGPSGAAEGAAAGSVAIDMSTISADVTRLMAAALAARGIEMLDCPVTGGPRMAEAGSLSIFIGGKEEVLARARPLLEVLGRNLFHMGDNGAGQVTKACNQVAQVVCIQGVAEALMLARANGVEAAKVIDALMPGIAGSKVLEVYGRNMAARNFATDIEARLHHKDFGIVVEMAEGQGVPMPATALVREQLERLMQLDWGKMDTSILLRVLEEERKAHVQ